MVFIEQKIKHRPLDNYNHRWNYHLVIRNILSCIFFLICLFACNNNRKAQAEHIDYTYTEEYKVAIQKFEDGIVNSSYKFDVALTNNKMKEDNDDIYFPLYEATYEEFKFFKNNRGEILQKFNGKIYKTLFEWRGWCTSFSYDDPYFFLKLSYRDLQNNIVTKIFTKENGIINFIDKQSTNLGEGRLTFVEKYYTEDKQND